MSHGAISSGELQMLDAIRLASKTQEIEARATFKVFQLENQIEILTRENNALQMMVSKHTQHQKNLQRGHREEMGDLVLKHEAEKARMEADYRTILGKAEGQLMIMEETIERDHLAAEQAKDQLEEAFQHQLELQQHAFDAQLAAMASSFQRQLGETQSEYENRLATTQKKAEDAMQSQEESLKARMLATKSRHKKELSELQRKAGEDIEEAKRREQLARDKDLELQELHKQELLKQHKQQAEQQLLQAAEKHESLTQHAAEVKSAAKFRAASLKKLVTEFKTDTLSQTGKVVELQAQVHRLEAEVQEFKDRDTDKTRAEMKKKIEKMILKWIFRSRLKRSIALAVESKPGGELDQVKERAGILKLIVQREARYLILLQTMMEEFLVKLPDSFFTSPHSHKFALLGFQSMRTAIQQIINSHTPIHENFKQAVFYETGERGQTAPMWKQIVKTIDTAYELYFAWIFVMQAVYAQLRGSNETYKAMSWDLCAAVSAKGQGALSEDNLWYYPIIQMSNYSLLIAKLLDLTPEYHLEYEKLKKLKDQLMEVSVAVEKRSVRLERIAAMQTKLQECPHNYVTMQHEFIMEGKLEVKDNEHEFDSRVVFLLRTVVVLAVPAPDNKLKFERQIKFKDCLRICEEEESQAPATEGPSMFSIETIDGERIQFYSAQGISIEIQAWKTAFGEAIVACAQQKLDDSDRASGDGELEIHSGTEDHDSNVNEPSEGEERQAPYGQGTISI